jgi:hypothetical protein
MRNRRKIYQMVILIAGVIALTSLFNPIFYRQIGESRLEIQNHRLIGTKKVLGASSEKDVLFGCTKEKPLIGWIDFSGKKVLRYELEEGQTASACFENEEKAQTEGYFFER